MSNTASVPRAGDSPTAETPGRRRRDRGDFVMVPRGLLYSEVSPKAAKLWAILDDCCRDAPGALATTGQLAAAMRVSPRDVRRFVAELVEEGWLNVHGREGGRGLATIFEPLQRRRVVDETWTDPSTFPRVNVDGSGRVSRVLHSSLRAREEKEGQGQLFGIDEGLVWQPGRGRRLPACGRCDETRHVEQPDGSVARCPACHPLADPF